jgi:hypothetical protein
VLRVERDDDSAPHVQCVIGFAPGGILAGWEVRLRTRFLGAVVPAAQSQPTVKGIFAGPTGWPNGLLGSKFWDSGCSTRSRDARSELQGVSSPIEVLACA